MTQDAADVRLELARKLLVPDAPRDALPAPPITGVTFAELQPHHCRWPLGKDVRDPDFRFCNKSRLPGRAYCAEHHERAYEPTPHRTQRQMILPPLGVKVRA